MKTRSLEKLLALCMAVAVGGCTPADQYAGGVVGAEPDAGSNLLNCYLFQCDKYQGQFDRSKRRPAYLIVWQAHSFGSTTSNGQNITTLLHGRSIMPPLTKKAAYALQPDHSLKELSLTEAELDRLFLLANSVDNNHPTLASDPAWQQKVQPHLQIVEPPKP